MATRMTTIKMLETLQGLNKPYFTVADFEKILEMERDSLYVILNRLVEKRVLTRLKRDVYASTFQRLDIARIANELYYPSYLSFESALSRFGIVNQIPYTLTFATNRPTKKLTIGGRVVEYKKLKSNCFFGYTLEDGVYIAEPEKAVLDQIYLMSKGKVAKDTREWSLVRMDKTKFLQYSRRFPKSVQAQAKSLVSKFGKRIVTLDSLEQ